MRCTIIMTGEKAAVRGNGRWTEKRDPKRDTEGKETVVLKAQTLSHAEAAPSRERVKKMLKTSLGDEHHKRPMDTRARQQHARARSARGNCVRSIHDLYRALLRRV